MQDVRITAGSSTPLPFIMVSPSDHTTPVVGASPTVTISQNTGAFVTPSAAVTERGNGWYQLAGGGATTGFVGPLLLHATWPGADDVDVRFEVVPFQGANVLVLNTARYPLTFLMVESSDHLTGASGLSPVVRLCKVGGSFSPPAGSVHEIGGDGAGLGHGWYYVSPNAVDTNTPGPLLLHASAPSADFTDERYDVAGVAGLIGKARYRLGPSLLSIRSLLINSGLFTGSSCIVSAAREPFPSPSPPCCAIAPGRFNTDVGLLTGGGRYETEVEGEYVIKVILRHAKDIATQDIIFYTDTNDGGYTIIERIINVLTEQFLYDPDANPLTTAGLKPTGVGEPQPYTKDPMYCLIPVGFRARILLDPDVPDPGDLPPGVDTAHPPRRGLSSTLFTPVHPFILY